jgi:hypothetical protein
VKHLTGEAPLTERTRKFSLRFTIASLVVGLLVATVAGVVAVALLIRGQTVAATAEILQREISSRITEKIEERFGPVGGILEEHRELALSGILPLNDQQLLGDLLLQRIRHDHRVEWIAFVRPDGSAVGAARKPDGTFEILHN